MAPTDWVRRRVRRRVRRWGWRLGLIAYCARCDGSMTEAIARQQAELAAAGIVSTHTAPVSGAMPMFAPDRWRFHRRHERARNDATLTTPLFPEGRRRVRRSDRVGVAGS